MIINLTSNSLMIEMKHHVSMLHLVLILKVVYFIKSQFYEVSVKPYLQKQTTVYSFPNKGKPKLSVFLYQ
ncbi:hypothetical protein C6A34_19400 [Bacillus thuringiensis]|nr:hypothetical protein C6A34_19400 [Bacillus thuringiensis]